MVFAVARTTSRSTLLLSLALGTIYVVWGSTYLAIRIMVETIPPLFGAGVRFLIPGLLFAAWVVARRGASALRVTRGQLAAVVLVATLLLVGGNGGVTVAEQDAPSGLAALIIAAVPLWVVLLRLLVGERVPRVTLAGVALGLGGVAILVIPGDRPDDAALWAVLMLVGSSACWATGSFVSSRVTLPDDVLVTTALQMLIGGALFLVAGLAAGENADFDAADVSLRSLLALVYLATAGSLVAFTAYLWLLENAPISTVATYAFVNPVFAVVLGWAVLDEELTAAMLAAAAVIVVSVAAVIRTERAPEPEPAPAGVPAEPPRS